MSVPQQEWKVQQKVQVDASMALKPDKAARRTRRNGGSSVATRLRILDAAEHLFAQNGVDGTSLRSIMAAAGVSISQINYHFGTKEVLLRAIFERRAVPHVQEQ